MMSDSLAYPDNPVLCAITRGDFVESVHRGAWALVDGSGAVREAGGSIEAPVFARSSIKSMQVLPLIETGAAARYALTDAEVALAVSSHNAEACHTSGVESLLGRLELGVEHLLCGAQIPGDPAARAALREAGTRPTAVHNNCSGKHAGFLALALHHGMDPARYLDPEGPSQTLVREAVIEVCGLDEAALTTAVDGCSAPTFRMPLVSMATGIARVANPEGLGPERRAACTRVLDAVAAHPELIAGRHRRLCTDLGKVTGGRLLPKIGAEGVYLVGARGADRGLAVKIDDGGGRALHAVVVELLNRFGLLEPEEYEALAKWRDAELRNWAGIHVGKTEVCA